MRMNFSSLDAVDEKTDLSERRLSIYLSAIGASSLPIFFGHGQRHIGLST